MKAMRQHRYDTLISEGFLPFEAQELSRQPSINHPVMIELRNERKAMIKNAIEGGQSAKEIKNRIMADYVRQGQMTQSGLVIWKQHVKPDVWKKVRAISDRRKALNKDYESPWERKQNRLKDINIKQVLKAQLN